MTAATRLRTRPRTARRAGRRSARAVLGTASRWSTRGRAVLQDARVSTRCTSPRPLFRAGASAFSAARCVASSLGSAARARGPMVISRRRARRGAACGGGDSFCRVRGLCARWTSRAPAAAGRARARRPLCGRRARVTRRPLSRWGHRRLRRSRRFGTPRRAWRVPSATSQRRRRRRATTLRRTTRRVGRLRRRCVGELGRARRVRLDHARAPTWPAPLRRRAARGVTRSSRDSSGALATGAASAPARAGPRRRGTPRASCAAARRARVGDAIGCRHGRRSAGVDVGGAPKFVDGRQRAPPRAPHPKEDRRPRSRLWAPAPRPSHVRLRGAQTSARGVTAAVAGGVAASRPRADADAARTRCARVQQPAASFARRRRDARARNGVAARARRLPPALSRARATPPASAGTSPARASPR